MPSTFASSNNETLQPCPSKPNCVSSQANDEHAIKPFTLANHSTLDESALIAVIQSMNTKVIVTQNDHRIHAEFTSRLFGFVDDVDLVLDTKQHVIHVRSASRTGHYDFGVNRRRVETLRSLLKDKGLIQ